MRCIVHNEAVQFSKRAGESFKWGSLLFWGVGMYAVMFFIWHLFETYGFVNGLAPRIALLTILIIVALSAGRSLRYNFVADVLPYAVGWTMIAMLLDALTVLPSAGLAMYADWNIWVGYGLLFGVPLLAPSTRPAPQPAEIT